MNSKMKGKVGELEFVHYLKERGYEARRGQQFQGGNDSPDVIGLPGHHVEVKRTEALRLHDALAQANRDAAAGTVPLVAYRRNRAGWVAILDMDHYIDMVKRIEEQEIELENAWYDAMEGDE